MGLNEVTAGMTPQEKKSISHTWKRDTWKKPRRFGWRKSEQVRIKNLWFKTFWRRDLTITNIPKNSFGASQSECWK